MTPQRWQIVNELFHECLPLEANARQCLLAEKTDDAAVRSEVSRLLLNIDQAGDHFLTTPDVVRRAFRDSSILQPGDTLGGRFRIERLIGRGGMGEVYQGVDTELGEQLAIKVLMLPPGASPEASARFRRELQIARRVTHPNVCRLFEINRHTFDWGEVEYFTMELLDGFTLSEALKSRGPFAVADAQPILTQILAGLEAAHSLGIVHRDLKPGNIMLVQSARQTGRLEKSQPRAVLMDFGVARVNDDSMSTSLTGTGNVIGTLAYISPEQLTGGAVSPRTDLYAFGLIWHEMLTGIKPFPSDTGIADALKRLNQTWSMGPDAHVPKHWRQAIEQCLERDAAHRPEDALALVDVVARPEGERSVTRDVFRAVRIYRRRLLAVALAAAVAGILFGGTSFIASTRKAVRRWTSPVPQLRHVALLPFESARPDEVAGIGTSLADSVASQLIRAEPLDKDFWLVSPGDLRAQDATTAEAAAKLFPVNLILKGSIARDSRNFIVTTRLADAKTGREILSRETLAPVDQLFRLSGLVANEISDMLRVNPPQGAELNPGTSVAEAFRAYEAGRAALTARNLEQTEVAIQKFQLAVELDSKFAKGYAALADAWNRKYALTKDPAAVELAQTNADRATELDAALPEVHKSLALVHSTRGRYDASIMELKRAQELDPGDPDTQELLANRYRSVGRVAEAESAYVRAIAMRPNGWSAHNWFGSFYYSQSRYAEAEREFQKVVDILPTQAMGFSNLGGVFASTGDCARAVPVLQRGLSVRPLAAIYSNLGICQYQLHLYEEAVASLESAVRLEPKQHQAWRNLGDTLQMIPGRQQASVAAFRQALAAAEGLLNVNEHDQRNLAGAALYAAKLGERANSNAFLRRADQAGQTDTRSQFWLAITEELNGNRMGAIRRLEQAIKSGLPIWEVNSATELAILRGSLDYSKIISRAKDKKQ